MTMEAEAQHSLLENFSFAGVHCETIERTLYTLYGRLAWWIRRRDDAASERPGAQKLLPFVKMSVLTHGRSTGHFGGRVLNLIRGTKYVLRCQCVI